MAYTALEFVDLLFWKLHRILDREGVSILQWAFMQRALNDSSGVPFSAIRRATGDSKDNVRRAAAFLDEAGVGEVIADPHDRRARIFVLTPRGKRRTLRVYEAFEEELRHSVGSRDADSKRAQQFNRQMWNTSCYLSSGDLAAKKMDEERKNNRADIPDDSLRYAESPKRPKSPFTDSDSNKPLF